MSKALVTFGVGTHQPVIDISRPYLLAYARRHNYDYIEPYCIEGKRPASWYKVLALIDVLQDYDEALWLDADVVIVDGSLDFAAQVPQDAWQALVCHHLADSGEVPNTGVWFVRRPMLPVLRQVWSMCEYINLPWWEQGAVMELMGYDSKVRPTVFLGETKLYHKTHFLPLEWNSHRRDEAKRPYFRHATPSGGRMEVMREYVREMDKGWLEGYA